MTLTEERARRIVKEFLGPVELRACDVCLHSRVKANRCTYAIKVVASSRGSVGGKSLKQQQTHYFLITGWTPSMGAADAAKLIRTGGFSDWPPYADAAIPAEPSGS
jgi:hypothetical protein